MFQDPESVYSNVTMSGNHQIAVEIVVDSVASAVAAERGGAARIELCTSLIEGGVTPSAGLIEVTRAAVSLGVYVMIRPRAGDFCYCKDEFEIMRHDILMAQRLGANGIALGILDANGDVDITRTRALVDLARPLEVTFHRAFDMAADLPQALEDVCATGADRLLTSGGEPTALQGAEAIAKLVKQAAGRLAIMPGSGIKPENARALVEKTGVLEIHAGLRTAVPSPMRKQNPRIVMGTAEGREYECFVTLDEDVRNLLDAVNQNR
jgi:copper homeostasis protein